MLEELYVLNGEMSLKFDPLNTKYTIILNNDDQEVLFRYKLKDNTDIKIEGNEALDSGSNIIITVFNDKSSVSYYFTVFRDKSTISNSEVADLVDLEIASKEEISIYAGPGIACTCFLLILFLFTVLFHKKKNKKCK